MKKLILNIIIKQIKAQGLIFLLELIQYIILELKNNRLNETEEAKPNIYVPQSNDDINETRKKGVFDFIGNLFNK